MWLKESANADENKVLPGQVEERFFDIHVGFGTSFKEFDAVFVSKCLSLFFADCLQSSMRLNLLSMRLNLSSMNIKLKNKHRAQKTIQDLDCKINLALGGKF